MCMREDVSPNLRLNGGNIGSILRIEFCNSFKEFVIIFVPDMRLVSKYNLSEFLNYSSCDRGCMVVHIPLMSLEGFSQYLSPDLQHWPYWSFHDSDDKILERIKNGGDKKD